VFGQGKSKSKSKGKSKRKGKGKNPTEVPSCHLRVKNKQNT